MDSIWISNMRTELKKKFFISTVESIVLYKSEAWSLMAAEEKSLYGMYTRMLRKATIVGLR